LALADCGMGGDCNDFWAYDTTAPCALFFVGACAGETYHRGKNFESIGAGILR
jgi:hypothetical protein